MTRWTSTILLALIASARAESPHHTCEASLLQKKHHRSRSILIGKPSHGKLQTYERLSEQDLGQMIMSNPWKCDLLPEWDIYRLPTCNKNLAEAGLHPSHLTALGNSSCDHKSSVRMLFPIGALPCCSTMPFCSAPACAESKSIAALAVAESVGKPKQASKKSEVVKAAEPKTCTKQDAHANFAYMTSPEVWPIYHGWGGSFDLDVQKHYDILHRVLRQPGRFEPFDLVIDVGANSGVITEKLTARGFARNYILVEAYKGMKTLFDTRFGNEDWKKRWFSEQVPQREDAQVPQLEFVNFAVSSKSEGSVDLCTSNMWSAMNNNVPCPVDKLALDDMIPGRLSENFQAIYGAAESAYVKTDVEGMDELALRGMSRLLQVRRGNYSNGEAKYLVNFMQMEFSPVLMDEFKRQAQEEGLANYDLKTMTSYLESMGFETFLMGPKYLPLSHGSWDDSFKSFMEDPQNSFGGSRYPIFESMSCPGPNCPTAPDYQLKNVVAADLFAVRKSHPKATRIKVALGACRESPDFDLTHE